MSDLIKALQIFLRYQDLMFPCCCCHDELHICIDPELVTDNDKEKLKKLSFEPDDMGGFCSTRFGSC